MSSPSVFIFQFGVHVAQSLVFCGSYFVIFCLFSFGHCIYCLFSFDLPLAITPLVSFGHCIYCLFSFDLPLVITPLVSFDHCIYCLFSFDLPLVITPLVSTNLFFLGTLCLHVLPLFACMSSHVLMIVQYLLVIIPIKIHYQWS